jgi:hypothetical protein
MPRGMKRSIQNPPTEHAPSDLGEVVDALLERQMKFCVETDGLSLKRVFTVS